MSTKKGQKVSIIIPYYNTSEFIKDCIDSILKQTYSNLELIIINDGSTKKESEYVESLIQDDRIVYIKNEVNKGVGYSRTIGMKYSSGQLVYFVDSDDILTNRTLEILVNNIGDFPAIFGETRKLWKPSDLEEVNERKEIVQVISSAELFKSGTILNILIKKKFLDEQNIQFSQDTKGFSDISVVVQFLEHVEELPIISFVTYYMRVRNDPITNPSLAQRGVDEITHEIIDVYLYQKQKPRSNIVDGFLDRFLLDFYRNNVTNIFKGNNERIDKFYSLFHVAISQMNLDVLDGQPLHIKRELINLKKGNQNKFKRVLKFHVEALEFKNGITGLTRLKGYIYKKVFLKLPMKENYIVFESFLGKNYSDSPRNIYEYIIENKLDFKCIWVLNDKNKNIPGKAKVVKRFSMAYYYYFAISKYWVNNMRQPLHLVKREGNVFLETWHGTPLKKLVFDMNEVYSANPRYKRDFYLQSRAWDYLLSPNQYSSEIFRSAFKFEKEMLEYGYPRNDILYSSNREEKAKSLKASLGIPNNKKVILYAPTWRDDDYYEPGKYKFDLKLDLKSMQEKFGNEYVVALRTHYFIADSLNIEGLDGFAYNLSRYDDISELYLISDILITDYSSVFFDYANLKRPILFYTYDLEKYRDQLRGFYIDFEADAPGPLLRTNSEIIEAIENIKQIEEEYAQTYEEFFEKFCSWHDGKSTERVVKRVFLNK